MSGPAVKDQILEQKLLPVLLPPRNSQGFQELCVGSRRQRPMYIFSIISLYLSGMSRPGTMSSITISPDLSVASGL